MATQRNCTICSTGVNELGAFVKLGGTRYAHLPCWSERVSEQAVSDHRNKEAMAAIAAEQVKAESARAAQLAAFRALPRCPRCGIRKSDGQMAQFLGFGELVASASGSVVCVPCTRLEAQARRDTRATAPSLLQQPPSAVNTASVQPKPAPEVPAAQELLERSENRAFKIDLD